MKKLQELFQEYTTMVHSIFDDIMSEDVYDVFDEIEKDFNEAFDDVLTEATAEVD